MNLRPFLLLSPLLLGACEEKQTAPGSHPPDIATTKATLRHPENEPSRIRGERPAKSEVMEELDSLIKALNENTLPREARNECGLTFNLFIQILDPADFDMVWKKLGTLEDAKLRDELRIHAIYHLAAGGDLVAAGVIMRERMLGEIAEGEVPGQLGALLAISDPTPSQLIAYLRQNESPAIRDMVSRSIPHNRFDRQGLAALAALVPPLTGDESRLIAGTMAGGLMFEPADVLYHDDGTEAASRLETISLLEGQGILDKGAREIYLRNLGYTHPNLFLKLIPAGELMNQLRKDGYDLVIGTIIWNEGELDPFGGSESAYPHTFFTPDGTRNLPPEKIPFAMNTWHRVNPEAAQSWFTTNAVTLPPPQQDEIRVSFALHLWSEDKAAAQAWIDQITDPALREKTIAGQQQE